MPLFGTKFSPKEAKTRNTRPPINSEDISEDQENENRAIRLRLGDQHLIFENGEWIPDSGATGNTHRYSQNLRSRVHALEEENNLLKIKFEVVMDMIAKRTAENEAQQKEIGKLQKRPKN